MTEKYLTDLEKGEEAIITAIQGGRGIRQRLGCLGLDEGKAIRKLSELALGGPVIVLINRAEVAIGRGMACRIQVRPVASSGG